MNDFAAEQNPHRVVIDCIVFVGDNDPLLLNLLQSQGPCGHRCDNDIQHVEGDAFGNPFDQSLPLLLKPNVLQGVNSLDGESGDREGLAGGCGKRNGACDARTSQFTADNHARGKVYPREGGLHLGRNVDRYRLRGGRDLEGETTDLQLRSRERFFIRPQKRGPRDQEKSQKP